MTIKQVTQTQQATADAVNNLLKDLSSTPHLFGMEDLEKLVSASNTHLYIAQEETTGRVVGMYTLASYSLPTGIRVWLEDVVVAHDAQGQGIGRKLVEHAISETQRLYPTATLMLTSRPSRLAANHIYASLFDKKETNVYQKKG